MVTFCYNELKGWDSNPCSKTKCSELIKTYGRDVQVTARQLLKLDSIILLDLEYVETFKNGFISGELKELGIELYADFAHKCPHPYFEIVINMLKQGNTTRAEYEELRDFSELFYATDYECIALCGIGLIAKAEEISGDHILYITKQHTKFCGSTKENYQRQKEIAFKYLD